MPLPFLLLLLAFSRVRAETSVTLVFDEIPGRIQVHLHRPTPGPLHLLPDPFADHPYHYRLEGPLPPSDDALDLRYTVRLDPPDRDCLVNLRSILYVPEQLEDPLTVMVEGPADLPVTTPWPASDEGTDRPGRRFLVGSIPELSDGFLLAGAQSVTEITVDRTRFRIAVSARLGEAAVGTLMGGVEAIARHHARVFGGSPEGTLTVLVAAHPTGREDAGGIFGASAGLYLGSRTREQGDFRLLMTSAHELFHLWNGGVIRPADPGRWAWFTEGLTDYYMILALSRIEAMGVTGMIHLLERAAEKYLTRAGELSIEDGGSRGAAARAFVYGGGALAALDLDLTLRLAGHGTLDDVMRELYTHCVRQGSFDDAAFEAILHRHLGGALEGWMDRSVRGRTAFEIEPLFAFAGLLASTERTADPRWPWNVTVREPPDPIVPRGPSGPMRAPFYLMLREPGPEGTESAAPLQNNPEK